MSPQPETRRKNPAAESARAGPIAVLVNASLVIPERVLGLHLLAADVAGNHNFPRQHVARGQVTPQRVYVAQLITADMAHVSHAAVHLFVVQHPADGGAVLVGTLITGEILHGTKVGPQSRLVFENFLAILAVLIIVVLQHVPSQGEEGETLSVAYAAHGGMVWFLWFAPPRTTPFLLRQDQFLKQLK